MAYFVQTITRLLSSLATLDEYERVAMPDAVDPFFGAKLGTWSKTLLHIFHNLQSDMVFGNVDPFS